MGTGCGLTLDTGALIALERRDRRMIAVLAAAHQADLVVTVPSPVLVEWFHGKPSRINPVLNAVIIEPLGESLARTAGVALVGTNGISVVDAVVMASAAQRGDYVYTSDIADLQRLQQAFPQVRLFGT
jgi:predicted nucleic acid-binding protein